MLIYHLGWAHTERHATNSVKVVKQRVWSSGRGALGVRRALARSRRLSGRGHSTLLSPVSY